MLNVLHEVERRLGELLADEGAWRSKRIDYTPPVVDRLYRDWSHEGVNYRVYLHRIYPCEKAFYHPHPWPSAIRVLPTPGAVYEMAVGGGDDYFAVEPLVAALIRVSGGMEYEMVERIGYHSVRIIGEPSVSVMVTGPVWDPGAPRTDSFNFRELDVDEREAILAPIRTQYSL